MKIYGDKMNSNDWNAIIRAVTDDLSPDDCGFEMDERAREIYGNMCAELKKMREDSPGVPVGFSMVEKDWD